MRAFLVLTTSWNDEYSRPCVICRIYRKQQDIIRVFPSVRIFSSVIVHFNDVDREYLRERGGQTSRCNGRYG